MRIFEDKIYGKIIVQDKEYDDKFGEDNLDPRKAFNRGNSMTDRPRNMFPESPDARSPTRPAFRRDANLTIDPSEVSRERKYVQL